MRILYLTILAFLLIIACRSEKRESNDVSDNLELITSLADKYVELAFKHFPENYVYYSFDNIDHGKLSDNSVEGIEEWNSVIDSLYLEFEKIPSEYEIGSKSWYLYGYLKELLESSIQLRVCKSEYSTINHLSGWHIGFQRVVSVQPVGSEKARNNAIKRWEQLPRYVDNEITNLKYGIAEGYTVPKEIVKVVVEQISKLLSEPVTESVFYSPAKRDTSESFKKAWEKIVRNTIYSSLERFHDFLKKEYYKSARESISLADLPDGIKAYEAYYRVNTSISRSVDEIIEVSTYRVKVNNSKLRLYGREKYGSDSLPFVLKNILKDTVNYFKTADEMLRFAKETVKKAREKCKELGFDEIPVQEVEVVAISEAMQSTIGSHYIPAIDSADKPSYYYINLSRPEVKMQSELETEIFHETYPGHHLQIGLAGEKDTLHLLTRMFTVGGYIEGWASYAQVLAEEMGLYSTGYSRYFVLGRSSRIMYLEAMIHSGKWGRDEAVKYLMNYSSFSEESAQSMVNRLAVWPGQISTYDTGLLEILELREKAMLTLGENFDIKEFHRIILEGGAMPLEMLREKVNWWLETKAEK